MKTHSNIATTGRFPFKAVPLSIAARNPDAAFQRFATIGDVPMERKGPILLVDLHNVTSIDSSELALFMEAMQRIEARGGNLVLFGVRDEVRHVFATAKLDQVFRIFSTRDEALADQAGLRMAAHPSLN